MVSRKTSPRQRGGTDSPPTRGTPARSSTADAVQEGHRGPAGQQQGDADAQCNLGVRYENGNVILQDHAEAAQLCRLAADQGHTQRGSSPSGECTTLV